MSKVEQIEAQLRELSQAALRQICEWLDKVFADELEFTPEFEEAIRQAKRDVAASGSTRAREPEGSSVLSAEPDSYPKVAESDFD